MNPIIIGIVFLALLVIFTIVIWRLVKSVRGHQQTEKPSAGLTENFAGLLSYVLGWISGLVFILAERKNKFVRFHAMQSIIVFGAINIVSLALGLITILGWMPVLLFLNSLISLIGFVLWILLMVKAYQGTKFKLPWAGNLAEKWAR